MSEETNAPESDGTWSGLKKTIIGTLTTVVAGGGVWLSTQLFGGHSEEEKDANLEKKNSLLEKIKEIIAKAETANGQAWNNLTTE